MGEALLNSSDENENNQFKEEVQSDYDQFRWEDLGSIKLYHHMIRLESMISDGAMSTSPLSVEQVSSLKSIRLLD